MARNRVGRQKTANCSGLGSHLSCLSLSGSYRSSQTPAYFIIPVTVRRLGYLPLPITLYTACTASIFSEFLSSRLIFSSAQRRSMAETKKNEKKKKNMKTFILIKAKLRKSEEKIWKYIDVGFRSSLYLLYCISSFDQHANMSLHCRTWNYANRICR